MDHFFESFQNINLDILELAINSVLSGTDINTDIYKDILNKNDSIKKENPMVYGCKHYLRRCKIISPCCNKIYDCRLCHDDENYNIETNILKKHKIDRFKIQEIICNNCEKKQLVHQYCENCHACFGLYFCEICNLFDDIDKGQFHCKKCGFCRIGGKENYFHCEKCNICIPIDMENHKCIDIMGSNCSICMEDMFSSIIPVIQMKCGHFIHRKCFNEMVNISYKCPLCSCSIVETDELNKLIDIEVLNTPMPEIYKDVDVNILCNDCHKENKIKYHIIGQKCSDCGSYNTRNI